MSSRNEPEKPPSSKDGAHDMQADTTPQVAAVATDTPSNQPHSTHVYSSFTMTQIKWIVIIAGSAAWYSTASSFIYFPAIPFLSQDYAVSIGRINLTVTSYLVASGLFPAVTGTAADNYGRRPVFILSLATYVVVNIGLALQKSFTALFILRMVQSASISGTFSIAYGVIGDLVAPAQRGGYTGVLSIFLNTPPSVAPSISGLLLIRWTWPSIFWFMAAISAISLFAVSTCLPETCRNVVGNGSRAISKYQKPLFPFLLPNLTISHPQSPATEKRPRAALNPFLILHLLVKKANLLAIVCFAIYYTVYSCLQASLSSLFVETYHVSGLIAGLIYIPFGVSCAIGAFFAGRILDWDYQRTARDQGYENNCRHLADISNFPIEYARLRSTKYFILACAPLIAGYGWAVQAKVHMAVPLVLQFLIGITNQHLFTSINTLLVDLNPNAASTAQAASNFVRCELAAAALAGLDPMISGLGPGWAFVIFAAIHVLTLPTLLTLAKHGLGWRQSQRQDLSMVNSSTY